MSKKLIASAAVGSIAAACGYGWYQNNVIEVTHRRVPADVENPLMLLCLSDLHGKQFGAHNHVLIKKAAELAPDLILFPGDTISSDCQNLGATVSTLKKLCAIAPCFLIPGNHEHRSGKWEKISAQLKSAGVTVLQNEIWSGEINGVAVNILGLDEGIARSRFDYIGAALGTLDYPKNAELFDKLEGLSGAKILLSHFPECFAKGEYCRFNFDLMVSGHAHGGHMRFNDRLSLFAAGQGFFPKFCQGLYGSGPRLLVCRGLGNDSPLPRINNRPEMAVVTLAPKRSHLF